MLREASLVCYDTDVLVLGGGLPGVCAAIQAARLGAKVLLVERSAVLGGNCGPELGVHPSDAHRFHSYLSSTGVVGELMEEAAYRGTVTDSPDHHYNISSQFDRVLYEGLQRAGVTVLLRHFAHTPDVVDGRIAAVLLEDTATYHRVRVEVRGCVIDDTGDGNVSALAGAAWRQGREGRGETGERSAPEQADNVTIGSSLVAYVRKTEHPVEFVKPEGTPPYHDGSWEMRNLWDWGEFPVKFFFPVETGGEGDTLENDHEIYQRLLGQLYSAWDEVKNKLYPDALRNFELTWVSPRVGKRETRRFVGAYTLTQTDIEAGRRFDDAIALGGFALDIHHPRPDDRRYVRIEFFSIPPVYGIPYRCLYTEDVENLLFASRLLSVTHIAHGSTRLQRTLATIGQAAGAAAALCLRLGETPRGLYEHGHMPALRQLLLREDATLLDMEKDDPADLAPRATVTASSEATYGVPGPYRMASAAEARGVELWGYPERIDTLSLRVENASAQAQRLRVRVLKYAPPRPWQTRDEYPYLPEEERHNEAEWGTDTRLSAFRTLHEGDVTVPAGWNDDLCLLQNLALGVRDETTDGDRVAVLLDAPDALRFAVSEQPLEFARRVVSVGAEAYQTAPGAPVYALSPAPLLGEAVQAVRGPIRRYSNMPLHMWRPTTLPAQLRLAWPEPVRVGELRLTFDTLARVWTDMPYERGAKAALQCVRRFAVTLRRAGESVFTQRVEENYHRVVRLSVPETEADELLLTLEETWQPGALPGVYDVRVYEHAPDGPFMR